jgi:hypothetical protein
MFPTYGLEYAVLPPISLLYFFYATDFTLPGMLFNNALLTFVAAAAAWWRSKQLVQVLGRRPDPTQLEPMWPALVFLLLVYLGALQVILAVAHLSYYRDGPLVQDVFDA